MAFLDDVAAIIRFRPKILEQLVRYVELFLRACQRNIEQPEFGGGLTFPLFRAVGFRVL